MSAGYEMAGGGGYPASLDIDPPAPQSRLSVFLRLLFVIPASIVAYIIGLVAAVCVLISWLAIVITGALPAGLADFITKAVVWTTRVQGYCFLLTDKYPPFSGDPSIPYPVRPSVTPQLTGRNRLTVFFRVIMAIPHVIVLEILGLAVGIVAFIAWLVGTFTGSVPPGLHTFIGGFARWNMRYMAYAMLLTDEYPPFSLS